ncbi:hypothetical protein B0A72_17425 [Flavobacterium pectinovorum]|uniref:Uncharacterized protein n=1 Tax=Flavobacterium pectinovorum TaxID=29533 RepID=A0AB36P0N1_9FLAO|nr:hypothetical protein B0A72_17425 [Flavobacterium pectinovorum]
MENLEIKKLGRLKLSLVIYFLIWFLFRINVSNSVDLLFGFHLKESIMNPAIKLPGFFML